MVHGGGQLMARCQVIDEQHLGVPSALELQCEAVADRVARPDRADCPQAFDLILPNDGQYHLMTMIVRRKGDVLTFNLGAYQFSYVFAGGEVTRQDETALPTLILGKLKKCIAARCWETVE